MTLRYDPAEIVGVDEQRGGLFAVTMAHREGDIGVVLRTHNTEGSADQHAHQVRTVLASWLEV